MVERRTKSIPKKKVVARRASAPTVSEHEHAHAHEPHPPAKPFDVHGETLERAAGFFRALGDPERLRMLGELIGGERCVTDLAERFDEGMSTISQRLRVLRAERLVHRRREGKHIYYALVDAHVRDLLLTAIDHATEPRIRTPDDEESR
jgi:ArsR family transcriptional regulator